MTAIIREEADPLPATVPAPFRWIVEQLLSKEPTDRYDSTRDLYRELRKVRDRLSESVTASTVSHAPSKAPKMPKFIMAVGLLAVGALGIFFLSPKPHNPANDRYTPIEVSLENPADASWSPDGTAFVYSAIFEGKRQAFVCYLNSTLSTRLTNLSNGASPLGWAPDSKRIFIAAANPAGNQPPQALFSLSVTGGEPELLMPLDVEMRSAGRVSPDGKALLARRIEADRTISLSFSSPVGSPWKRYVPAPFESKQASDMPAFGLSPDGKKIVYFLTNGDGEEQTWLLPFPPGSGTPKRISHGRWGRNTSFSWFPDSRHIAASIRSGELNGRRILSVLDSATGVGKPITGGLEYETFPAVSPDGKRILFTDSSREYRIVAASLKDASLRTWIRSQLQMDMPLWASKRDCFVYETSAHGEPEIWLREINGGERPVLTQSPFPPGTGSDFGTPALSPDGTRLAVRLIPPEGPVVIWIASVAGGTPVRLTNGIGREYMAAWSPDGARIVYLGRRDGIESIMIAKTSGQATPVELVRVSAGLLPDWSPANDWIVYSAKRGSWALISPDGKERRDLGKIATQHLTFSKDGKTLYGIRAEGEHQYLFSLTIATGQMKTVGDVGSEFAPRSSLNPGIRFSVSPDGQSILYSTSSAKTGLWMLEGFEKP
jgi:Tol biopolymer transport system component